MKKDECATHIPDTKTGKNDDVDKSVGPPDKDSSDGADATHSSDEPESWRHVVGQGMELVSSVINENIVAARYGTIASIALLSAYGLASTPLFFRFKTVNDIPSSYFFRRRSIHGRLIRVVDNADQVTTGPRTAEKPIICLVRHLSPAGRWLSRSAFDFIMRSHPAAGIADEESHELLRIELAAVREPPLYNVPSYVEQPGEWLRRLAEQRAPVSCQLLSRRARLEDTPAKRETAALAEFRRVSGDEQVAICHVRYRPRGRLLRRDLAQSLVRHGRASLASSMFETVENWPVLDTSDRVEDLKQDTNYVKKLEKAEYEAAKESAGMWADPIVKDGRQDLVDEISFQTRANVFQKIWRWLRG